MEVVVNGRGIVPCGHLVKTLPELRSVGLPPVEPANVIRGRHKDVRGQRTTGANSAFRPLGKFISGGLRTTLANALRWPQRPSNTVAKGTWASWQWFIKISVDM